MGTRAVITFYDPETRMRYSVYQHWDGDPYTIESNIRNIKNAWEWPRYEADEFAAAYVATYKNGPGNIRLSPGPRHHSDLSYEYEVHRNSKGLELVVDDGAERRFIAISFPTKEDENGRA